jgi:predicted lysophospholipase L1 biosynthesis ABC-type transport system permease subunit
MRFFRVTGQRQLKRTPRVTVLVRSAGDPSTAVSTIRRDVGALDPALPLFSVATLTDDRGLAVAGARGGRPLSALGTFALALAALGIYGVLSYAVAQRRQEIAIRMALGAQQGGVLWLVLRQGLLLTVAGSAAGILAAWLAARALAAVLFGVGPGDPAALAGATALALVVALIACVLPAWRASRLDPLAALRSDA